MNDHDYNFMIRFIRERIKKLLSTRDPPYELPADSFLDEAAKEIIFQFEKLNKK